MDGPEIIGLYYLKSFKLITQFRAYDGQCWRQRNVIFSASLGYSNCSPPSHLNLNLTPFRGLQWAKWRKRTGIFWTICSTDQLLYHSQPLTTWEQNKIDKTLNGLGRGFQKICTLHGQSCNLDHVSMSMFSFCFRQILHHGTELVTAAARVHQGKCKLSILILVVLIVCLKEVEDVQRKKCWLQCLPPLSSPMAFSSSRFFLQWFSWNQVHDATIWCYQDFTHVTLISEICLSMYIFK